MTRKQALADLIAKVEAGKAPTKEEWKIVFPDRGVEDDDYSRAMKAEGACLGSLDAALALDRAIPTPNAIMSAKDMAIVLFVRNGARHWLLWKLKALHAQEGEG